MKFYLRRVYLDRGGYAHKGKEYFGLGDPLYYYESVEHPIKSGYVRAHNRNEAKLSVALRRSDSEAKFFN